MPANRPRRVIMAASFCAFDELLQSRSQTQELPMPMLGIVPLPEPFR
jgi:hypothetical protein